MCFWRLPCCLDLLTILYSSSGLSSSLFSNRPMFPPRVSSVSTLRNSSAWFRAALRICFGSRPFDSGYHHICPILLRWIYLDPTQRRILKMLSVQKPYFSEAGCFHWDHYLKVGVNSEGMCNCVEFHPTPSLVGSICLGQMAMGVHFLLFHSGPVSESSVESGPESLERTMSSQKIETKLTSEPLHDARCPAGFQRPMLNQWLSAQLWLLLLLHGPVLPFIERPFQ